MVAISSIETGKRIKELMDLKGIRVREIAKAAGLTVQAVYKWLAGSAIPSVDNLLIMSELFDTSIDAIIGKEEIEEGGHGMKNDIERILNEENKSIKDLAVMLGRSENYVSGVVHGHKEPSLKLAIQICNVLNRDFEDVWCMYDVN